MALAGSLVYATAWPNGKGVCQSFCRCLELWGAQLCGFCVTTLFMLVPLGTAGVIARCFGGFKEDNVLRNRTRNAPLRGFAVLVPLG